MNAKPSLPTLFAPYVLAGVLLFAAGSAYAGGKVHWKPVPSSPGCSMLAFDDTDQWFQAGGTPFRQGVCDGKRIHYKVAVAPDGGSFTATGANLCTYVVGEGHELLTTCRPNPAALR